MAELNLLNFAYQLQDAVERLMSAADDIQKNKEKPRGWEKLGYARGKLDALSWAFSEAGEDSFCGKSIKQIFTLLKGAVSYIDEDTNPTASIALIFTRNLIRNLEEERRKKKEEEE